MIKLNAVSKTYTQGNGPRIALNSISLTIPAEKSFGLIGPSGAGKSTLLRLINQLEVPDEGHITIDGHLLSSLTATEQRLNRQGIGMIFQQFNLLNNKTVYDNIALPLKLQGRKELQAIEDMMTFVNIRELAQQYPQQLSGGQKQRVAIARALSFHPKILLCDEPTSSLDEQHTDEIIQLLKSVQETFQTTLVIVSHEFSVIRQLCQQAAILEDGRLIDVIPVKPPSAEMSYDSYYQRALESLSQ